MEPAKATFRRHEGFVPNPKLRLREQLREGMRFKQFSLRTEEAYWNWIRRFILFHAQRHPKEMSQPEVAGLLAHMEGTLGLLARRLYGTDLRLMEGLRLRVKDIDFWSQPNHCA